MKFRELEEELEAIPSGVEDKVLAFKAYWPVIRKILLFIKIWVGKKADAKIDEIINWGDSL